MSTVDGGTLRPLGRVSEISDVVNRILDLEPLLSSPGHTRSLSTEEKPLEFLVEFEVHTPEEAPAKEVEVRNRAEAAAAARLVDEGHLVRLWKLTAAPGETKALGLYRADTKAQLDGLLRALPLYDWMQVTVTALEPHPNDPPPTRVGIDGDGHRAPATRVPRAS
jgi:muconolactone delta-isomerase